MKLFTMSDVAFVPAVSGLAPGPWADTTAARVRPRTDADSSFFIGGWLLFNGVVDGARRARCHLCKRAHPLLPCAPDRAESSPAAHHSFTARRPPDPCRQDERRA